MDIVFVILHYMVADETCKAISYIKKNIDTDSYKIIVVDNASPNDSYQILKEKYENDERIVLIQNEKNLGFAKGNNVGYMYAKKNCNPQFIVMLNNDVYLLDKYILRHLKEEYDKEPFAVAGPLIISPRGGITGPGRNTIYTVEECEYMIKRKSEDIFWTRLHLYQGLQLYRRMKAKICRILHISNKNNIRCQNKDLNNDELPAFLRRKENVELHGCCLIFSKKYIDFWDGLDSRTYLYCEESILHAHMMLTGERTVYLPCIAVLHNGDVATNAILKTKNSKRLFDFENSKKGFLVLKEVLIEYQGGHL